MLPQELISRTERAQVVARVRQVRGVAILHRPVEELAPPFWSSLHHRKIVGREGHRRETAEELVGIPYLLSIDARLPSLRADLHLDSAHTARQLEPADDQRAVLRAEPHQLRKLLRPQRPQRAEQVAGLEEIRLPLPVLSEQHGGVRRNMDALSFEVPEGTRLDVEEKHQEALTP